VAELNGGKGGDLHALTRVFTGELFLARAKQSKPKETHLEGTHLSKKKKKYQVGEDPFSKGKRSTTKNMTGELESCRNKKGFSGRKSSPSMVSAFPLE